jgi:hypothetical protein
MPPLASELRSLRRAIYCALSLSFMIGPGSTLGSQEPQGPPSDPGALSDVEATAPFTVRELKGTIFSSRHQPLAEAEFVLDFGNLRFVGVFTNPQGSFTLVTNQSTLVHHGIPPGTYRFKARKEGFHSTVGYVIISPDVPKDNVMDIELQPGPAGDDRTTEQRARDWERTQLPACSPGVERDPKRHKFPGATVDMPVTLGLCAIRTPEIAMKRKGRYLFMLDADKSPGFNRINCMLGLFSGPSARSRYQCQDGDPLLKADWMVWLGDQVLSRGSSPLEDHGLWSNDGVDKVLGHFEAEAGKKYAVEVKFLKDGSAINAANPHLVVQEY